MKTARIFKIAIPFIWLGAVCAISFMEAPLKFNAPNLTRPVALEIGHIVFDALNKAEWVLCIGLGIVVFVTKARRIEAVIFGLIALILLLQTFWLFPLLDERTLAIIGGRSVPESNLHMVYIVLELIKVVLLPIFGIAAIKNALEEAGNSNNGLNE